MIDRFRLRKQLIRQETLLFFGGRTIDELTDIFETGTKAAIKLEEKVIGSMADKDEADEYAEMLAADRLEATNLLWELAVVGLHKSAEVTTRRAVSLAFPKSDTSSLFKIKALTKALQQKGIALSRVRCFRSFDELRCISNAVKHSGVVGDELADFVRWKKGMPLGDLKPHFLRLSPLVAKYIADLGGRLVQKAVK